MNIRQNISVIFKYLRVILITMFICFFSALSVYSIWGWLTLSDFRKYCDKHSLDYYKLLANLATGADIKMEITKDEIAKISTDSSEAYSPLYQFTIPFSSVKVSNTEKDENGKTKIKEASVMQGALLEPFMALTESASNTLFSLAIGYMVGVGIICVELISSRGTTHKRAMIRPILGAISAALCYIVILSGGALIWNQVAGVSGLSLGVISVIGAIYGERFTKYVSMTL